MPAQRLRDEERFPNRVRLTRKAARLTQDQLLELCEGLAKEYPDAYSSLVKSTLSALENGHQKPQPRTAATLSKALRSELDMLFPNGVDDFVHNPEGKRNRQPGTNLGGRPKN